MIPGVLCNLFTFSDPEKSKEQFERPQMGFPLLFAEATRNVLYVLYAQTKQSLGTVSLTERDVVSVQTHQKHKRELVKRHFKPSVCLGLRSGCSSQGPFKCVYSFPADKSQYFVFLQKIQTLV